MSFLDLASFEAARADLNPFHPSLYPCPYRTQVGIKASVSQVMSMRHTMAEHRFLTAVITNS
jgi:hypothetical protein